MRLTVKFMVKAALVLVFMIFLGPVLINWLDRSKNKVHKVQHHNGGNEAGIHVDRAAQLAKPAPEEDGGQFAADGGNPREQVEGHPIIPRQVGPPEIEEPFPSKTFGPKQVLKEGELGNYESNPVNKKTGPGDNGAAVYTSMSEKAAADRSIAEYGFNMVASNKMAMDRIVPDTRMEECKYWHYPEELPTASVILVFHNEGWSTLLRTVHSIVNRSPKKLLKEIVMVDDFSTKPHLKEPLKKYLDDNFGEVVKLYRNPKREGLIQTRTNGASYSTGDVIIFLDAHCECQRNWLSPLLARIAYDRTIMAVPIVDSVNWDNFRYTAQYTTNHHRGIFEWGFLYKESQVPQSVLSKRKHHSEPYWSPTHAGGLFAMDKKYFLELGAYDPGMQIWGGENFELSFKIWQCGGSVEWVPCSRVGHVYRNHMPYGFGNISPKIPIVLLNYMRVVEVWLDPEFKEYFYTREPMIRGYPIGDISKQLHFKKEHKCKSFKWFIENIAPEVLERFPAPPPNQAWGEIKQKAGYQCWDTKGAPLGGEIGMSGCHHYGGNQLYRINTKGQLATGERCIIASSGRIRYTFCDVMPTGSWVYDENKMTIYNKAADKCVQGEGSSLLLKPCDPDNLGQQWVINQVRTWK